MSPARLRIALDATPLTAPSGGIARYTAELAAALAARFPEDEYWLVSDQPWQGGPAAPNLFRGERPRNWITQRWWLAGLPLQLRRLDADLFHGTDFAVPYLNRLPSVLTLHDLSPWKTGEQRAVAAGRVRRRAPLAIRRATMILTPSEAIRREAAERFGLPLSRLAAVPLAPAEQFRPLREGEIASVLARLKIRCPYLMFVGTRERRKNLPRLVEAWREAGRIIPELSLVVAGRPGADASEVLNFLPEPGLHLPGLLADSDLAALLAGAAAFVYPSLYEGFGLPVLEAMRAGAPVVISRDPALLEVAAEAAIAVDADSIADLARAIVELTGNPARRAEYRERGFRRAAQFSWGETAVRTRQVYVEAIRRF